jgi:hypothetical protein
MLAAMQLARVVVGFEESGSKEALRQQQQRMQALSLLLQETALLLDAFCDARSEPAHTTQAATATAAAAAGRAGAADGGSSARRGCSCSGNNNSSSSSMSAAEVGWQIAAVAGGAAWSLVLCGIQAAGANASTEASQLAPSTAVQLALLTTAVQALQGSTQAGLEGWATVAAQQDAAPTSRQQKQHQHHDAQQQRPGAGLSAGSGTPGAEHAAAAARSCLKQDVLTQVRVIDCSACMAAMCHDVNIDTGCLTCAVSLQKPNLT